MKKCCLKKTPVKLMDGQEYDMRALPFTEETVGVLRALVSKRTVADSPEAKEQAQRQVLDQVEVMTKAIRKCLSYDNPPEVVDELLEYGAVPVMSDDREEARAVLDAILEAMGVR